MKVRANMKCESAPSSIEHVLEQCKILPSFISAGLHSHLGGRHHCCCQFTADKGKEAGFKPESFGLLKFCGIWPEVCGGLGSQ